MARRRGAVAAPNSSGVEAGLAQLDDGGNAVDAAVAAVIAASVTEPGIVAPMGGAFVNVWAPGQEPLVVDGNVEMPGRGQPPEAFGSGLEQIDMEYGGGITVHGGHGSVATPGMFLALSDAHARWGSLPWHALLQPSIDVTRNGYALGSAAAYYLTFSGTSLFAWHEQTRAWMSQGGHGPVPVAGQTMNSPHLSRSLEAIAGQGAQCLYTGELAEVIAADMAEHGGLITRADLAAYRTVTRPALRTRLGDWDVAINPGPSIGGPVLTTMLRLLAHRWADGVPDPARRAEDILAIQEHVLTYRHRHLDPAEDLLLAGAEMIDVVQDEGLEGLVARLTSPNTIHVSAVDEDGLACSVTTSAGYGSGLTTPGTGLMFNNALGEPELNRKGLHALPPGTRLASNMAPTTARDSRGGALAIGSPGADRITTALMQVLAGITLVGLDLQHAVEAPRLHVAIDEGGAPHYLYEAGPGLREGVEAARRAASAGEAATVTRYEEPSMFFGGVAVAERADDGTLYAVADPRREAAVGTRHG